MADYSMLPLLSMFSPVQYHFCNRNICNTLGHPGKLNISIGYIIRGSVTFTVNGTQLPAGPGDIVYQPKGSYFFSDWRGDPDIEFFGTAFLFRYSKVSVDGQDKICAGPVPGLAYEFQVLKSGEFPEVREDFEAIHRLYSGIPEEQLLSLSRFYQLLNTLSGYLKKDASAGIPSAVNNAVEYIENNYTEEFDVPELASLCGISQSRFYTLFKAATGYTPVEYKNTVRIGYAADMLLDGRTTVEEISQRLGFCSPAYFRRMFCRITGFTPREYRSGVK